MVTSMSRRCALLQVNELHCSWNLRLVESRACGSGHGKMRLVSLLGIGEDDDEMHVNP